MKHIVGGGGEGGGGLMISVSLLRTVYENRYVTHPLLLFKKDT